MSRASPRFTSADLELMPDDGKRYEVIDGELFVSKQPSWSHQMVCTVLASELHTWSRETDAGRVNGAPGLIFAEDDDVAPDLVWASNATLATALWADGKLHAAPELIVEVLSPGPANERRDRDAKLKLYSRRGVVEYWIVDWPTRRVEVHRRENLRLRLIATLREADTLESPLLPGFALPIERLFADLPRAEG
jgi:Uma2 family endonuclease